MLYDTVQSGEHHKFLQRETHLTFHARYRIYSISIIPPLFSFFPIYHFSLRYKTGEKLSPLSPPPLFLFSPLPFSCRSPFVSVWKYPALGSTPPTTRLPISTFSRWFISTDVAAHKYCTNYGTALCINFFIFSLLLYSYLRTPPSAKAPRPKYNFSSLTAL